MDVNLGVETFFEGAKVLIQLGVGGMKHFKMLNFVAQLREI